MEGHHFFVVIFIIFLSLQESSCFMSLSSSLSSSSSSSSSSSIIGRQLILDPSRVCKLKRLKGKSRFVCKQEPDVVRQIRLGSLLALTECQSQFKDRKWNCSPDKRSLRRIVAKDTRESAFVHAILSAGMAFAVAQACSTGELLECSCQRMVKSNRIPTITLGLGTTDFDWRGCSDNIDFGHRKSKEFLDEFGLRRSRDLKSLILAHNYEAGRMVVKSKMRTDCKCHGMSGSCSLKTCWQKLPTFAEVGLALKEKFDGSIKVIPGNDGRRFQPEVESMKRPSRDDLIYSEDSPNFCIADIKTGSLGTTGRLCNATSADVDGCDLLCCGRGYETLKVVEKVNCNCHFRWCCHVQCDTCSYKKVIHRCL